MKLRLRYLLGENTVESICVSEDFDILYRMVNEMYRSLPEMRSTELLPVEVCVPLLNAWLGVVVASDNSKGTFVIHDFIGCLAGRSVKGTARTVNMSILHAAFRRGEHSRHSRTTCS